MSSSALDDFIAVATGVSALATAVSAAVIAVQAYWTRRSVQVAERATLLSRRMAVEATKSRLDARAPLISVMKLGDIEWPPLEPSVSAGGQPNPLQIGQSYHLPRDGNRPIMVRALIGLSNRSDTTAVLDFSDLVPRDWRPGMPKPTECTLYPRSSVECFVQTVRTVTEWVQIFQQRAQGEPGNESVAYLRHSDAPDDGVIDKWEIVLAGTPVVPVSDQHGVWTLAPKLRADAPFPSVAVDVRPMVRDYYLSKKGNTLLDKG